MPSLLFLSTTRHKRLQGPRQRENQKMEGDWVVGLPCGGKLPVKLPTWVGEGAEGKTESFFFNVLFIFERERAGAWAGEGERERERETQNPKRTPDSSIGTEPDAGPEPMNCEIMTWAKVWYLTDWATQVPQERERLLSKLYTQCRAQCGAWSHDPRIMTWAKIKSQMLHRLIHPGVTKLT